MDVDSACEFYVHSLLLRVFPLQYLDFDRVPIIVDSSLFNSYNYSESSVLLKCV